MLQNMAPPGNMFFSTVRISNTQRLNISSFFLFFEFTKTDLTLSNHTCPTNVVISVNCNRALHCVVFDFDNVPKAQLLVAMACFGEKQNWRKNKKWKALLTKISTKWRSRGFYTPPSSWERVYEYCSSQFWEAQCFFQLDRYGILSASVFQIPFL